MSGKGDTPRPIEDYEKYSSNWDLIFGKNKKESSDTSNTKQPIEEHREKSSNS